MANFFLIIIKFEEYESFFVLEHKALFKNSYWKNAFKFFSSITIS